MKKNTHLPVHQIIYCCISCDNEYQTTSTSSQNIRIESCSNCNPFYTGTSASEVKFGAVEKFRQRVQRFKEKLAKKS